MVGSNSPPTNELFDALSSDRRRRVLTILQQTEQITTEELSRRVADLEVDDGGSGVSPDREEVSVSLVHNHLPRLSDISLVAYDAHDGTVARGEAFETVLPIVERATTLADEIEDPKSDAQSPSSGASLLESITVDR